MPLPDFKVFTAKLDKLKELIKKLPSTVLRASEEDRISQVFKSIPVEKDIAKHWEIFNRRMDSLFGSELRNEKGRLLNFKKGPLGLDLVIAYIDECVGSGTLQWDLAAIKVDRLVNECEELIQESQIQKKKAALIVDSGDEDDEDYVPLKNPRKEPDVEKDVFDEDGNEIIEVTEAGEDLEAKRKKKKAKLAAKDSTKAASNKSSKKTASGKTKKGATTEESPIEIDSGDESDGNSALRKVQERERQTEAARRGPQNGSMQHFFPPVAVVDTKGGKRWEFRCRHCPRVRTFERKVDGPDPKFDDEKVLPRLNNLATHVAECKKTEDHTKESDPPLTESMKLKQSVKLMEGFLKEGALNPSIEPTQTGFQRLFAAWILDESLPWTTGESPTLASLFEYLRVTYTLPTDTTVRKELARIFAELHGKIVKQFAAVKSKIAFATDTWTTKQMVYTFACTVASFIDDDWKLIEHVIDFQPLQDKQHEGFYAGLAFVEARCVLARHGIPHTPDMHIRCIAHVINLVVQDFLHKIDEAEDPDKEDWYETCKDLPIHYDPSSDEEQEKLDKEDLSKITVGPEDTPDDSDEAELAEALGDESAVKRLRFITTKIVSSPQRRLQFRKIAKEKYAGKSDPSVARLAELMVIRDIRTRWNYTHAMIRRSLLQREAIDTWTFNNEALRAIVLSKNDWKQLEQIADVLEIFTEATLQMSISQYPTIPFVLPVYELMKNKLTLTIESPAVPPLLRGAARAALSKLHKYREKALNNQYYKLAAVLHPGMRAEWFKLTVKGSDPIAATYIKDEVSEPTPTQSDDNAFREAAASSAGGVLSSILDFEIDDIVVPATMTPKEMFEDELRRYLRFEGGRGNAMNPLVWWKQHEGSFPTVARMARDYLAIPATSVSVERTFSKSRHICSDLRMSMKAKTISEALLVKVWVGTDLFDAHEPLKRKRKHGEIS
ncbi:hypothetical protein D9613_004630 [Agrocybe pediades]|uniref:HAT C-terminal dimerisation domain-containing protein n=1 Tax=Agrocybe pediades TaxID=84607 RepID=A0A8H4QJ16_9AGAR|nr:hypothetical protein D9613_004630 [Agrocybe pediades]